jgi:hypothetical protein
MSQLLSNRPPGDIVFATIQKLMNGKEQGTPLKQGGIRGLL